MLDPPPPPFLGGAVEMDLNKKIFSIKFLIKKAIFIFGVRCPLTDRTVTVGRVANKVRVASPLQQFYVLKYRSSDAFPAPEIFFSFTNAV